MTRAQKLAFRFRILLLALWIIGLLGAIAWLLLTRPDGINVCGLHFTPSLAIFGPFYENIGNSALSFWGPALFYIFLFAFTQWLFLSTHHHWKIKTTVQARPIRRAAISAAFVVALLSVGLIYTLLDLKEGYVLSIVNSDSSFRYGFYMIPLLMWVSWSVLFFIYLKKHNFNTFIGKFLRGLFAGSLLEMMIAVPVYATRQDSCYCVRGSYAGIIFGATALLWAFGPGVIFLYLREKNRREELEKPDSPDETVTVAK